MGNSLQQHRSAIGCFHGGTKWRKKDKKDNMFIWHAKKDLVFSMVFLQLLLLVVITMKVEVAFDPGSGPDYFKVMQNPSLLGGVSVHLFFIFVQLWTKKDLFHFQVTQCYLQDVFSFSTVRRALLLQQGIESNPGPTTIGEAIEWYRETCKSGNRSEEQIKTEALRFFILWQHTMSYYDNKDSLPLRSSIAVMGHLWLLLELE